MEERYCSYCGRKMKYLQTDRRNLNEWRCPKWGTFIGWLNGTGFKHDFQYVDVTYSPNFDTKTGQKL